METYKKETTIQSCHLSTGQLLELGRFGRVYFVMVASPELFQPPIVHRYLNINQARDIYADYLQADVCETY